MSNNIITDSQDIVSLMSEGTPVGRGFRIDADTIFTARDLEMIESDVMQEEYEQLDGALLTPFNMGVPEWYKSVTARTASGGGDPVLVQAGTTQIPNVDSSIQEDTWNMRRFAVKASWSDLDLMASAALGRPLDASSAIAAVQALNTKINTVIFEGLLGKGLRGIFNTKQVPRIRASVGFNSNSTSLAILEELHNIVDDVAEDTSNVEKPNRLALSSRAYKYIKKTPMSADNGTSILNQFLEDNQYITSIGQVHSMPKLNSITTGGDALLEVAMAYNFDMGKLQTAIVNPRGHEMRRVGLGMQQIYTASMSEVQWRRPKSGRIVFDTNRDA